jgi:heme oxygenase
MDLSHNSTLIDALKEAIRERHARMETLPFVIALTEGRLPRESYVGQLRATARILAVLEHELAQLPSTAIKDLLADCPSRLVHLRQDLTLLDRLHIPDVAAATEPTRMIAERIRHYRIEQPKQLLAVLYVLQGTILGNTVHLPDILKNFGDQTAGAAYFYAGYGDKTAECWRKFCMAMNAFPIQRDEYEKITRAAPEFFDLLEALFLALYPIQKEGQIFTAGMINHEAGEHPVPQDIKEIEAAVAAAQKCCVEIPYYLERYQERGQRFAASDAAWLATLSELPMTQLVGQVEWLGRVLSNRGMPRITMERQLELLYQELSAAVPAKRGQYAGLLEAAANMKRERLSQIPEQVFRSLAQEFQTRTNDELQGRFKRTGDLLLSAVCDEAAGITQAVPSLLPWLQDASRFPPQWIIAVNTVVQQAREAVQVQKN